ncbi:chromosome segregation protein Spc25-domain-containing protein [Limtongia smithiae]|uniref:chromosome segregation protein Spc25-domain-containing protein n=1 Tax=Limtongia smithiae TaxID=1125753 RepID=UPI0034CD839D
MASTASAKSNLNAANFLADGNSTAGAMLDSPSGLERKVPQFLYDFIALKGKLDTFQITFDRYIADDRTKILEDRNKFEKEITDGKEEEQSMLKKIDHYKALEEEIAQEILRERQEIQETEQSISEFSRKKDELSVVHDAIIKQIADTQTMLESKREERSKEYSKLLSQSSLNAPELLFWEQNLGMRIESVQDDYLKIIFSLLSEVQWNKEYYVIIDLTSHDYEITRCEPALDKSILDNLVLRLNESRDFSRFLKELRTTFKSSGL